jgi:predicted PurR-regulated permease PerM
MRWQAMPQTARDRFAHVLFYALVLLMGYLAFVVLSPFLASLAWAAVFAMTFYPVYRRLAARLGPNGAALATTLITAVMIVAPAVMLVSVLAREVPQMIDYVQKASLSAPAQIERVWDVLRRRSPMALPEDPAALLREGLQRTLTFLAPRAGGVLADAVATLGSLFVMLFSLFFMLRDGHVLGRRIRDLLPLPERERDRLVTETRDLVIASVGAGLLVAAAQGAVGGVTFWLLGLGAPVLWGVAMAMCALIPLVGSALVWAPTAVWLLFSGEIGRAVILILVGVLGIGTVDNVLRPLLLSGRTTASGLVIFLGLLGGVSAFGFIGLVLGPIVLVTAGSLLSVFTRPDLVDESGPPPTIGSRKTS